MKNKKMTKEEISNAIVNILNNDYTEFERFYEEFRLKICNFIANIIKDNNLAEDITQNVFAKIINKADSYNPKKNPINWVYTIAHNEAVSFIRKNSKMQFNKNIEIKDSYNNIDTYLSNDYFFNQISDLKTIERVIIYMRLVDDLQFKDIARILSRNTSSVKWKYYNALKKINLGEENEKKQRRNY